MGNNVSFGDQLRRQATQPEPAGPDPVQSEIGGIVHTIQYYCENAAKNKQRSFSGYIGWPPAYSDIYEWSLTTPDKVLNPKKYVRDCTPEYIKKTRERFLYPKDQRVIDGVRKAFENKGLIVTSNYFAAEGGVTMCHAVFLRP